MLFFFIIPPPHRPISNKCQKYPSCNPTNGKAESTNKVDNKCQCDINNVCDADTGHFCYGYGGICAKSAIDVCANKKGAVKNTLECQCGPKLCSANQYCMVSSLINSVMKPNYPYCTDTFNDATIHFAATDWMDGTLPYVGRVNSVVDDGGTDTYTVDTYKNVWTFTIDRMKIKAAIGATVTQGTFTGTIKKELSGKTTSTVVVDVVESNDVTFDANTDLIVGSTTISSAKIIDATKMTVTFEVDDVLLYLYYAKTQECKGLENSNTYRVASVNGNALTLELRTYQSQKLKIESNKIKVTSACGTLALLEIDGEVETMTTSPAVITKWGHIKNWDISQVTNLDGLFQTSTNWNAANQLDKFYKDPTTTKRFNADLSKWTTSNVIRAVGTFGSLAHFNSDVSKWDVSNVEKLDRLFGWAASFDRDVSKWNVAKATSMASIFASSTSIRKWAAEPWCKSAGFTEASVKNRLLCCMKGEHYDSTKTLTYNPNRNYDTCTKCPAGKVQPTDRVVPLA